MKIGFFSDTYFPQVSGVSTSIKTLKEGLEKSGHQVYIFTTSDPAAEPSEEQIIRLPSIPFWSFKDRRIAISGKKKALKIARELQLDVVHTQTEFSLGFVGKYVAEKMNLPHLHTYHTMYEDYLHYIAGGKMLRPQHVAYLSRYFCNSADGIIAPSSKVEKQLHQYGVTSQIKIIPTGVDLEKFSRQSEGRDVRAELGIADHQPMILSLSRLSKEKNIEAILKSMPKILKTQPKAMFVIVGDGPQKEELEMLAKELDVSHAVIFTGEKKSDEVRDYYTAADVFVSASSSESQGLTYIEAISSGTSIVAKLSNYTQSLVGPKGELGSLFVKDDSLAEVILNQLSRKVSGEEQKKFKKILLNEISSDTFSERVLFFYEKAAELYKEAPFMQMANIS
ncbi:glycosyltransferase family 4 protein [Vagococcus elongatus]|uniref:1,2-diacylglycerol 3-glucosyltransferase n=1 Tax=Vagococcus elongatus TaxID=180344 RepID=A0A430B4H5_9ENTE|nr:glycosyltransferase family 4 protein [Vagococcus elongatus]RSU15203.1 1,2-diacylglycerol 3-glucosyltransferase [Vagococcus elongatus]